MAVTAFGTGYQLSASGDKLNQATIGHPGGGNYRLRCNQINFVNAAATTIATVKVNGTIIWSQTVNTANTTVVITAFGEPQELDDIEATTLPAGATLIVFTR